MKNEDQPIEMADGSIYHEPLTKREHFCLVNGVPETGDKELDNIIKKGNRKKLAGLAMQSLTLASLSSDSVSESFRIAARIDGIMITEVIAKCAIEHADVLLKQLEK